MAAFERCLSGSRVTRHSHLARACRVSPTDQGTCAGLSRWGTVPSCVSGSLAATRQLTGEVECTSRTKRSARPVPAGPH
eukprot:6672449-Prymnesium_polylepis.1